VEVVVGLGFEVDAAEGTFIGAPAVKIAEIVCS